MFNNHESERKTTLKQNVKKYGIGTLISSCGLFTSFFSAGTTVAGALIDHPLANIFEGIGFAGIGIGGFIALTGIIIICMKGHNKDATDTADERTSLTSELTSNYPLKNSNV